MREVEALPTHPMGRFFFGRDFPYTSGRMRLPRRSVIFVFVVIALMLSFVEARPAMPDPDSFYHAKMALTIRDQGFIRSFPWLQETVMRDEYVNAHWLYHVLLIPFVTAFDPLVGIKVSAVLFGLAAFYALYRLLRSVGSPYPEWLTLVGALSFDFLQRMSLPKAGSLSVAILIFAVWAMLNRRFRTLFVIAVLYVWLYHGWPVLLAAFACLVLGDIVSRQLAPSDKPPFSAQLGEWVKTAGAMAAGLVVGMVVNPYFPTNVAFTVVDILKIAVIGKVDIPVGTEWYPIAWTTMFQNEILALATFGLALVAFIPAGASKAFHLSRERVRSTFALLFLAALFAAFTFRSIRYMEYFVPFLLLTTGSIFAIVKPFLRQEVEPWLLHVWRTTPRLAAATIAFLSLAVASLALGSVDYSYAKTGYFSASQYEGSARWLKRYLPRNEIVFNALWDSSLAYFYLDDSHYFLVGLDPRFMYDNDKDRYQAWFDLQSGKDADVSKIETFFHASAVLVDRRLKGDFVKNLEASGQFEKTYEDEWTKIYIPR